MVQRAQARQRWSVRRTGGVPAPSLRSAHCDQQSVPEPADGGTPAPPETMTVDGVEEFSWNV